METTPTRSEAKSTFCRREVVAGLSAMVAAAGCKSISAESNASKPPAAGQPGCAVDNASTAKHRAVLAFWLMLVSNNDFCPINPANQTVSLALDKPTLMSYLSALPQGLVTSNPDQDYIDFVVSLIRSKEYGLVTLRDANNQEVTVHLTYLAAFQAVRDAFQKAATTPSGPESPYIHGEVCKGIENILSLVTNQQTFPTVPYFPRASGSH